MKTILSIALLMFALPALATVPVKHVTMIKVTSDHTAHVDIRERHYTAALTGCTNEQLEALELPVTVSTQSRALREGTKVTFTGSDGKRVVCQMEAVSKL